MKNLNPEKPLVDKEYLLERFQGKGGWTYALIPEIALDKHSPFGWVRVCGTIDDFEISNSHLMPMKNGKLILPVKAEIRKKIKKDAGDYVKLTLFADYLPPEIPEDLKLCLLDEPKALEIFQAYTNGEQKAFIDWIYSAKTDDTKIDRMARTIEKVKKRLKFTDKK